MTFSLAPTHTDMVSFEIVESRKMNMETTTFHNSPHIRNRTGLQPDQPPPETLLISSFNNLSREDFLSYGWQNFNVMNPNVQNAMVNTIISSDKIYNRINGESNLTHRVRIGDRIASDLAVLEYYQASHYSFEQMYGELQKSVHDSGFKHRTGTARALVVETLRDPQRKSAHEGAAIEWSKNLSINHLYDYITFAQLANKLEEVRIGQSQTDPNATFDSRTALIQILGETKPQFSGKEHPKLSELADIAKEIESTTHYLRLQKSGPSKEGLLLSSIEHDSTLKNMQEITQLAKIQKDIEIKKRKPQLMKLVVVSDYEHATTIGATINTWDKTTQDFSAQTMKIFSTDQAPVTGIAEYLVNKPDRTRFLLTQYHQAVQAIIQITNPQQRSNIAHIDGKKLADMRATLLTTLTHPHSQIKPIDESVSVEELQSLTPQLSGRFHLTTVLPHETDKSITRAKNDIEKVIKQRSPKEKTSLVQAVANVIYTGTSEKKPTN